MSKPHDGAEETFFVLGQVCVRIYDWNEHYIKDEEAINKLIIFDVSDQKYFNWNEFVDVIHQTSAELGVTPDTKARRHLKRLRYKAYLPIEFIPRKKVLKTKKKIENKFVSTPSSKQQKIKKF